MTSRIAIRPLLPLGGLLLLAATGCGGFSSKASGDHAGQVNGPFRITPASATLVTGEVLRFTANSPWGGGATWTVVPAAGGSFDALGNFTASSVLGSYQIVAMSSQDVRYTATATVTVVAPPPPAHLNPNLVQASGTPQASPNGSIKNAPVVGEPMPATRAADPSGSVQVRHGFDPSVAH